MSNDNHSDKPYEGKPDPRLDTEKRVDHLHAPSHEVSDDCPACEPEQCEPTEAPMEDMLEPEHCEPEMEPALDFDVALHSLASALARETRPEVRRKMIEEAVEIMNRGIRTPAPKPELYEPPGYRAEPVETPPNYVPTNQFEPAPYPSAPEQSFGDYVVDRGFNPKGRMDMDQVKCNTGHLIDLMGQIREYGHPEQHRLAKLAITTYEEACMWAVKALTKEPR